MSMKESHYENCNACTFCLSLVKTVYVSMPYKTSQFKWPFLWNANVSLESHLLRYPKLPAYFIHVGSSANLRNIRPSSVYNHYKVPLVQPPACSSDLVLRF